VAGDVLPREPGYLDWLADAGFGTGTFVHTIDVTDQGLDNGSATAPDHPDFYVNGIAPGTDRVTYAHNWTADADARDCGGHGTNVASIAAGFATADRVDADGFRYGLGVSPRARIGASKVFDCRAQFDLSFPDSFTDVADFAYAGGARITNNSWGFSDRGEYTVDSQEYDALVRDAQPSSSGNQPMVEVSAAGNDGARGYGTVGSPGTAKNVITVGASESVRAIGREDGCGVDDLEADDPDDVLDLSSRGPTRDGRLKPDLVAPGTHVVGARPQHDDYTGVASCIPFFDGMQELAPVRDLAGGAGGVRRGLPHPRLVGARARWAGLSRVDEGAAREHRDRRRGRRQR
jgi:Subtilase family